MRIHPKCRATTLTGRGLNQPAYKKQVMKNLKYKGYTYTVYLRPWKKGDARYEVIKYETGFRNLWERSSIAEYRKVASALSAIAANK